MKLEGSVKQVVLFHRGGEGAPALAADLRPRLGPQADIEVIDLDTVTGDVPVPLPMLASIGLYGDACLPVLVVDGVVVRQGRLPEGPEALDLIERPVPDTGRDLELDLLLAAVDPDGDSCCKPGCC